MNVLSNYHAHACAALPHDVIDEHHASALNAVLPTAAVFACRIHAQYNQPGSLDQGRRPVHSVDRCNAGCRLGVSFDTGQHRQHDREIWFVCVTNFKPRAQAAEQYVRHGVSLAQGERERNRNAMISAPPTQVPAHLLVGAAGGGLLRDVPRGARLEHHRADLGRQIRCRPPPPRVPRMREASPLSAGFGGVQEIRELPSGC